MKYQKEDIVKGIGEGVKMFLESKNSMSYGLDQQFSEILKDGIASGVKRYLESKNWEPNS